MCSSELSASRSKPKDLTSPPSLKQWHTNPRLISSEPGFIPFSLQILFKALSMSPANSFAKNLFPLWDRCTLSVTSRPVLGRETHDQKITKFWWRHQSWRQLLICWLFPFLPSSFPAIGRIENTACDPDPLISLPTALKSVLLALGLLIATSSLPTWQSNDNSMAVPG